MVKISFYLIYAPCHTDAFFWSGLGGEDKASVSSGNRTRTWSPSPVTTLGMSYSGQCNPTHWNMQQEWGAEKWKQGGIWDTQTQQERQYGEMSVQTQCYTKLCTYGTVTGSWEDFRVLEPTGNVFPAEQMPGHVVDTATSPRSILLPMSASRHQIFKPKFIRFVSHPPLLLVLPGMRTT